MTGQCTPDCPEEAVFPWTVKINGQAAHSFNANRISELIPKPGEIEHWTYINGGGGWDHPIHLHFEEGVTMNRGGAPIPATELNVRKDVWRLRDCGRVQFQVQFGEYGGSYVNHCHNTVHEDFALLMRIQLLSAAGPQVAITPTPNPTPDGVFFTTPEVLPEGDPSGSAHRRRLGSTRRRVDGKTLRPHSRDCADAASGCGSATVSQAKRTWNMAPPSGDWPTSIEP